MSTESGSEYRVDLDARYRQHIPGTTPSADPAVAPATHLRRDSEPLKVLRILALRVGSRAVFDLEPLGDPEVDPYARRTTTFVPAITPWEDND